MTDECPSTPILVSVNLSVVYELCAFIDAVISNIPITVTTTLFMFLGIQTDISLHIEKIVDDAHGHSYRVKFN